MKVYQYYVYIGKSKYRPIPFRISKYTILSDSCLLCKLLSLVNVKINELNIDRFCRKLYIYKPNTIPKVLNILLCISRIFYF